MTEHPSRRLAVLLLAAASLGSACAKKHYTHLYATKPYAPGWTADDAGSMDHLGPTIIDQGGEHGVNFAVFSEHATRVDLVLFDDPDQSQPAKQLTMQRFGNVWNLYVEGVGVGQHYGYVAWGPNWPYDPQWYPGSIYGFQADVDPLGNRFDPNKLLLDPYAKAVHREHDWSKGSIASGPKRAESTFAAAAKSVVVRSSYAWSANEAQWQACRADPNCAGHRWNDVIAYETHVKGFTMNSASLVQHPGTYRGFAEKADYFNQLGVNAVELMPVFEKPIDGGYWGYQTLDFFAPEREYAFDNDETECAEGKVVDEFKAMVDALHQKGIEVILDVVYNHTGEGGFWRQKIEIDGPSPDPITDLTNFDPKEVAGLYSYRGLDNVAYYALSLSDPTFYMNNTGVGQDTRCNYTPMRRLIMDSLHYWVQEMHVDGFRFDLAPILAEKDLDWNRDDVSKTVIQEIADDPILQAHNTRLIAEPWRYGDYMYSNFPAAQNAPGYAWGEWNGPFRDWWRIYLDCDGQQTSQFTCCNDPNAAQGGTCSTPQYHGLDYSGETAGLDGGALLLGSQSKFQWNGRAPYHAWNFVTIHDGFTMYDLFSYDYKANTCGPLNPVCCDQPFSSFCDRDSGTNQNYARNWGTEEMKRQLMRDMFVAMMVSHGTPLLLGGDEWERTQLGNNNAYSQKADNEFNWYDWGTWQAQPARWRMFDFVKDVIQMRKDHAYAFAPDDYATAYVPKWIAPDGSTNVNWSGKTVGVYYDDPSRGAPLLILMNMEQASSAWVNFALPAGNWYRLVDTQQYFDNDAFFQNNPGADPKTSQNATLGGDAQPVGTAVYQLPPKTIVVLEAR